MVDTTILYRIENETFSFRRKHAKSVTFDSAILESLPTTLKTIEKLSKHYGRTAEIIKAVIHDSVSNKSFLYTPEFSKML